ncbi:MAG: leucyl aminopeptidase [Rhodospirillales bacterium]|nr:leucyl aminopeptidase [Rhodospirillales bacterium]
MKITFAKLAPPRRGAYVVGVYADRKLTPSAKALDKATRGVVARALAASRFKGKAGQTLQVLAPARSGLAAILLVGLGEAKKIDALAMQGAGGAAYAALAGSGIGSVSVAVDAPEGAKLSAADLAAELAFGIRLRSYRFDKYRTKEKPEDKPALKAAAILTPEPDKARVRYAVLERIADGVFFTRDLVSEPPNVLYPETLAKEAQTLTKLGVKVEVLGVEEMRKLGMNALLGVGQGSARESKLVVMEWPGTAKTKEAAKAKGKDKGGKDSGPVAFVGKGVTFDTGGISLKPGAGMEEMKWDMGGAGAVIGAMKALAGRKSKAHAVGVIGLVENMPDGKAQRPGDIVKSMSGQTIEIQNTDAEGRLVLADALWYCKTRFKPRFMIDLATLTGAIVIALGHEKAGLFANDDELASRIAEAGGKVGERVWRMPLDPAYDKMMDSDIADVKNISGKRDAGSITAAQFLQRFVDKTPWAHLDIAGMAWANKDLATVPKGGTGFGVRLLDRLVADFYE